MLGSDVALFKASDPETIVDSYIVEERSVPKVDECQNWELISTTIEDGWMIIEMIRPLDTMDTQDHEIINDSNILAPTRLIAAWGDSDTVSYHGFNVGKIATYLFDQQSDVASSRTEDFHTVMDAQSEGFFEIRENNFTIPPRDTTYQYVCKTFAELQVEYNLPNPGNGSLYFIGAEAIISPETEQYVHHFIVGGGRSTGGCGEETQEMMLWGWAPGEEPQAFPPDVGFAMFGPDSQIQTLVIQIHYNNPAGVPDQIGEIRDG
jgi:Copper type II ascorbate-dependent monooxygenase, N-terminal domain